MKKFLIFTALFFASLAFAAKVQNPHSINPGAKCSPLKDGRNICKNTASQHNWCDPVEGKCVPSLKEGSKCAGHLHECGKDSVCGPQGVCVKVDENKRRQMDAIKLQKKMLDVQLKLTSIFVPSDYKDLMSALEPALNAALASKDFDAGIDKLGDAVGDIAKEFAKQIVVSKDLHTKVTKAIKIALDEFDSIVRSKSVPTVQGEVYLIQIVKSGLQGIQKGFAKAKVAAEKSVKIKTKTKASKVKKAATA